MAVWLDRNLMKFSQMFFTWCTLIFFVHASVVSPGCKIIKNGKILLPLRL